MAAKSKSAAPRASAKERATTTRRKSADPTTLATRTSDSDPESTSSSSLDSTSTDDPSTTSAPPSTTSQTSMPTPLVLSCNIDGASTQCATLTAGPTATSTPEASTGTPVGNNNAAAVAIGSIVSVILVFVLVFLIWSYRVGRLTLPPWFRRLRHRPSGGALPRSEMNRSSRYMTLASTYTPIQRDQVPPEDPSRPGTREMRQATTGSIVAPTGFYTPNLLEKQRVYEMPSSPTQSFSKLSMIAQSASSRAASMKKPKRPPKTEISRKPVPSIAASDIPPVPSRAETPNVQRLSAMEKQVDDNTWEVDDVCLPRPTLYLQTNSDPNSIQTQSSGVIAQRSVYSPTQQFGLQHVQNSSAWPSPPEPSHPPIRPISIVDRPPPPASIISAPSTHNPLSSNDAPPSPLTISTRPSFRIRKPTFSIPRKPLPLKKGADFSRGPSRSSRMSTVSSAGSFRSINSWVSMQAKRLTVNQGQKAEQVDVEVPKIPEKYRFPMPPGHDKSSEAVDAQSGENDSGKEVVPVAAEGIEVVPEPLRIRPQPKWY